jgi:hypothetical protein
MVGFFPDGDSITIALVSDDIVSTVRNEICHANKPVRLALPVTFQMQVASEEKYLQAENGPGTLSTAVDEEGRAPLLRFRAFKRIWREADFF